MTHKELVKIAHDWCKSRHGFAFRELYTLSIEIPDVIAFRSDYSTFIECKVSRADFLRDAKKLPRMNEEFQMGNYRLYCAPVGLINPNELPKGWGLLEVNELGGAKLIKDIFKYSNRKEYFHPLTMSGYKYERAMMYSALRRINLRGHMESIYEKGYEMQTVTDIAGDGRDGELKI